MLVRPLTSVTSLTGPLWMPIRTAKFRVLAQRLGDLERTARRLFGAVTKDQRHPVAGRQPNELFVGRVAHLRRPEHDLRQLAEALLLFLDQELGVTDDVDE